MQDSSAIKLALELIVSQCKQRNFLVEIQLSFVIETLYGLYMYTILVLLVSTVALVARIGALGSVLRPTFDLFCLFFLMLVFVPFGIIIDHLQQDKYLPYIRRFKTAMFPTPEPFLIALLFFSVFFVSYVLISRRNRTTQEISSKSDNYHLPLIYAAAVLSVIYLFTGMFINGFLC